MSRKPAGRFLGVVAMAALPVLLSAGLSGCDSNGASAATPGEDGRNAVLNRDDVRNLPGPLRSMLGELGARPHTSLPNTVFSEADTPSQLFGYYLLTGNAIQPNVFTAIIPGINDGTLPTAANAANLQLPTVGTVRLVLEPKPGKPTDPNDVEAFIDMFTDISGLFVINNESGWYEGFMIHNVRVPQVAAPRSDGSGNAQYGMITAGDAAALQALGSNNVPGNFFTRDGGTPRFPSASDVFPNPATTPNVLPVYLSIGTFNAQQQSDVHAYWEFNEYTDFSFPLYELPFTGGLPGSFDAGNQYARQSLIAGDGPSGRPENSRVAFGDDPNNPRDPDRNQASDPADPDRPTAGDEEHLETRLRSIPTALANEVLLDAYLRLNSFEPAVSNANQRLFDAYAAEVARVDEDANGVLSFEEVDAEGTSDGASNERLYIPAPEFNALAVTREINDGLLAPRFAPSQRAWVLSGNLTLVSPAVAASLPRDADNR